MLNQLRRGLAPLAVLLCAAAVHAQTVDEIIEKNIAATGGRAALEKVASRVTTGTITVSTPGGDITGSIEVYNKAPNKARTLIQIDASQFNLGKIVQDQRFNGTAGYAIDSLNGNREMTGDQVELAKASTFPTPLLRYKERGIKIELAGREKVGERDAYVLRIAPPAGPPARMFIDADTYLVVKTVVTVNAPQVGDVEQTQLVSDYRDVNGVKVPFEVRSVNQFQTLVIRVAKVDDNVDIDEKMFSKPAE